MPKERSTSEMKQQRNKKKDSNSKYAAGIINLQVLGSGALGSPTSLYVFTDQTRYLFNCGEGTQRLAHEHKMKLSKLEHIFLTSKTWDKVGGLPGVALTIQDIGVPSITLHGPPGLAKLFEATRRFVILNELQVKVANLSSENGFEDNVLNIDYVFLLPNPDGNTGSSSSDDSVIEEDTTDYYSSVKGFKRHLDITHETENPKKTKTEKIVPMKHPEPPASVLCYICRPKEKKGTLLIDKCIELGVPPGPLLGRLKSGEDIKLPDGRIVKADDVRSADCPGPIFIVVDCPNEEYLDSLVENKRFVAHQDSASSEQDCAQVVIHFTPAVVMQNPKYLQWMERFRFSTNHLILNDICQGMGSEAVHRIQHKLNLLDSCMFPLLKEDNPRIMDTVTPKPTENTKLKELKVPLIMGETLLKYNLRPNIYLDTSSNVTLNPTEYINETMRADGFAFELESLHSKLSTLPCLYENEKFDGEYPQYLFLGTGSCIPNKTRNTSGILVHLNSTTSMLLDCGEGTYGQVIRFFGYKEGQRVLSQLKAIFISHLHADHHLGLINILQQRNKAILDLQQPFSSVSLIAPQQIYSWLNLYHQQFEKIKPLFELIACGNVILNNLGLDPAYYDEKLLTPLGMQKVETIGVKHCPNAYGVAFTHKDGWKFTYSGDTMPCDNLVVLGTDSDVLIHEATMEDELQHEAVIKMHSTTSEAIEMGRKMNAKFVLLTHFSQRYAKVPVINEHFGSNVGIAFDNMRVRLKDLGKIPFMYPAMKCMFAEHCEDMEFKTSKKLKNMEGKQVKN